MCTLYAFCGVLFGLCSLTSLTVLSTVCCLKVCYPAYGKCWDALSDLYLHPFYILLLWATSTSSGKALPQGYLFPVNTPVQQTLKAFITCVFTPLHLHGAMEPRHPVPMTCACISAVPASRACFTLGLRSIIQKSVKGLSSLCRKVPAAVSQQVAGFRSSMHRLELRPEQTLHLGSHKL